MAKEKIAILGGGVGAITTAFALTSQEGWQDRYEITLYQLGWRLGGKGASGRNTDPDKHYRIEEHGLHIWLGFYDNAFRCMRACYEELDRPQGVPLATLDEAFKPQNFTVTMDAVRLLEGPGPVDSWGRWPTLYPPNDYVPGVGGLEITTLGSEQQVKHLWDFAQVGFRYLFNQYRRLVESVAKHKSGGVFSAGDVEAIRQEMWKQSSLAKDRSFVALARALSPQLAPPESGLAHIAEKLADDVFGQPELLKAILPLKLEADAGDAGEVLIKAMHDFGLIVQQHFRREDGSVMLSDDTVKGIYDLIVHLLQAFNRILAIVLRPLLTYDSELRRAWTKIGLGCAMMSGSIQEDVFTKGLNVVDDLEFREFLAKYGANAPIFLDAPQVRAWYDLGFCFEGGDHKKGNVAASVSLRGFIRGLFTYKGAIMWEMQAGMGDTIFGPYYEVLQRRGVKFKFFQRVTKLRLGQVVIGRPTITSIELSEQAKTVGDQPYDPLLNINGLPCWPSTPLYDQIVNGENLKALIQSGAYSPEGPPNQQAWPEQPYTLKLGKDYDRIVLGISVGALPDICTELAAGVNSWKDMFLNLQTVRTQAFQLWLKTDTYRGLGWEMPRTVLSAYVQPIDTWADMTHLVPREAWPPLPGQYPLGIAYFCGPLLNNIPPGQALETVKQNAIQYLQENAAILWPKGAGEGNFKWDWLIDLRTGQFSGPAHFDSQYWRANWYGSELYVLSVKGSTKYRIRDTGIDNLFVAGDWTDNGFNTGCVESATMSGLLASNAMTGYPLLDTIVGLNF